MSHRSHVVSLIFLVFSFSISARSQEQAPPSAPDKSAAAATKKKAIDLVISVAGQTDMLRSAENRARIRSNAAELLWDEDEQRARRLFAAVGEDIKSGLADSDSDSSEGMHTNSVFSQLRSDTVERIAKHDPELAVEFLNTTQLPKEAILSERVQALQDSLGLRLAGQIAMKSPQLALKLGRESLEKGFSEDLLLVLFRSQPKDKEGSLGLYKAIVDKLKSADVANGGQTTEFALDLVRRYQPPLADEQTYKDLLGILLKGALAAGCADATDFNPSVMCYEIGTIFSQVEKYHPQRAAPLKRWNQGYRGYEDVMATPIEVSEVDENGTADEILALVKKYPGVQDDLYVRAMLKAANSGDLEKARQIASAVPDENRRSFLLEQVEHLQKFNRASAENLAVIQQTLSNLDSDEERMNYLLYAAGRFASDDPKQALEFMSQAVQLVEKGRPGKDQMHQRVVLAIVYSVLKSDRGFAIVESLIPKLNQLVAAAAELDGFETNYLRDEEWNMSAAGAVGELLTLLAQNAGFFARLDFDRSVVLANQLDRSELRLMAELKIAQGVLREQQYPVGLLK